MVHEDDGAALDGSQPDIFHETMDRSKLPWP